jgi:hypothetical protein
MSSTQDSRQLIKEFQERTRWGVVESCENQGPEFSKQYRYTYTLGEITSTSGWKTRKDCAKIEAADDFVPKLRAAKYIR